MDRTTDLLSYWKQESEEMEWATAGPRRDKSQENRFTNSITKEAQKPLALLEHYCTEGKISHGHIDDRQRLLPTTTCQYDLSSSLIRLLKDMHALLMYVCIAHKHQLPVRISQVLV